MQHDKTSVAERSTRIGRSKNADARPVIKATTKITTTIRLVPLVTTKTMTAMTTKTDDGCGNGETKGSCPRSAAATKA